MGLVVSRIHPATLALLLAKDGLTPIIPAIMAIHTGIVHIHGDLTIPVHGIIILSSVERSITVPGLMFAGEDDVSPGAIPVMPMEPVIILGTILPVLLLTRTHMKIARIPDIPEAERVSRIRVRLDGADLTHAKLPCGDVSLLTVFITGQFPALL